MAKPKPRVRPHGPSHYMVTMTEIGFPRLEQYDSAGQPIRSCRLCMAMEQRDPANQRPCTGPVSMKPEDWLR